MNWQYLPHLPLVVLLCLSSCIGVASRVNLIANGLGLTPPMGWNSWNRFQCDINETLIKETADAIVSSGLAKLGYQYVNLDDCWAEYNRTAKGELVGKRSTFPSGIKALADYVHSRGLKLGIYSSAGYRTCSNRMPGSLGYENTDAKTFASWGIDYLKYDNCYNGGINETKRYPEMSRALQKSGRSIFYNLCAWGHAGVAKWGFKFGNSWRTTTDIRDNWTSIISIADENEAFAEYARPGGWNDPDMLEIGNGGMTQNEYIVHFSLWAISKAPLLLGCDIRTMSEKAMAIVANQEVIAINQDPIGVQAKKVNKDEDLEVWAGPLAGGRTVALLLNLSSKKSHFVTANWHDLGLATNTIVQARDVWKHETFKVLLTNKLTAKVGPHSCKMFVLKPSTG